MPRFVCLIETEDGEERQVTVTAPNKDKAADAAIDEYGAVGVNDVSYDYQTERAGIFTEAGVERLMGVRDKVKALIKTAGAFRLGEAGFASWEEMACVDYMVELGELVELKRECWGQFRVFTTPQVHNR